MYSSLRPARRVGSVGEGALRGGGKGRGLASGTSCAGSVVSGGSGTVLPLYWLGIGDVGSVGHSDAVMLLYWRCIAKCTGDVGSVVIGGISPLMTRWRGRGIFVITLKVGDC